MKKNQTVLAVLAHPDDETIFNGTLAMLAENNVDIYTIYATSGNCGVDATGQSLHGNELAKVREMELSNALKILKISNPPVLLRFNDGKLSENVEPLKKEIKKVFDAVKPEIVITFGREGFTGHPDHKMLSSVVGVIVESKDFVKQLLHIAISEERHQIYENIFKNASIANLIPDKKIDLKINVSNFAQKRKKSVIAHRTQFPDEACALWNKFVDAMPYEEFKCKKRPVCKKQVLSKKIQKTPFFSIFEMLSY